MIVACLAETSLSFERSAPLSLLLSMVTVWVNNDFFMLRKGCTFFLLSCSQRSLLCSLSTFPGKIETCAHDSVFPWRQIACSLQGQSSRWPGSLANNPSNRVVGSRQPVLRPLASLLVKTVSRIIMPCRTFLLPLSVPLCHLLAPQHRGMSSHERKLWQGPSRQNKFFYRNWKFSQSFCKRTVLCEIWKSITLKTWTAVPSPQLSHLVHLSGELSWFLSCSMPLGVTVLLLCLFIKPL